jgi:hypothetical protein
MRSLMTDTLSSFNGRVWVRVRVSGVNVANVSYDRQAWLRSLTKVFQFSSTL